MGGIDVVSLQERGSEKLVTFGDFEGIGCSRKGKVPGYGVMQLGMLL
jgi:hypothetical protein